VLIKNEGEAEERFKEIITPWGLVSPLFVFDIFKPHINHELQIDSFTQKKQVDIVRNDLYIEH